MFSGSYWGILRSSQGHIYLTCCVVVMLVKTDSKEASPEASYISAFSCNPSLNCKQEAHLHVIIYKCGTLRKLNALEQMKNMKI